MNESSPSIHGEIRINRPPVLPTGYMMNTVARSGGISPGLAVKSSRCLDRRVEIDY